MVGRSSRSGGLGDRHGTVLVRSHAMARREGTQEVQVEEERQGLFLLREHVRIQLTQLEVMYSLLDVLVIHPDDRLPLHLRDIEISSNSIKIKNNNSSVVPAHSLLLHLYHHLLRSLPFELLQ